MKNKIRNMYPGGNTPYGFYSYYNYILPQREAEKFFCIKGGPGVGKSTMMKKIGQHFSDMGEDVDYLWCSSDPDSLDGVLLKDRSIAIVDGTAPHIVDPKNPAAVDRIVDLGKCWDREAIKKNRYDIIKCNERIGRLFGLAYGYLRCAREKYIFMAQLLDRIISYEEIREYKNQLQMKLDGISVIRRAESRARKDNVLGRAGYSGRIKKAFAGAITPGGIRSYTDSIISGVEKVIVLETPVGFRTEKLLAPVSERLIDAGFDTEEYYCPMFPDEKLEHIVCADAGIAVISVNRYHDIDLGSITGKVIRMRIGDSPAGNEYEKEHEILRDLWKSAHRELLSTVDILKLAKKQHDLLENYYVPNMDFAAVGKIQDELIKEIEETGKTSEK